MFGSVELVNSIGKSGKTFLALIWFKIVACAAAFM
jgi:hypothetical protein